MSNAKRKCTGCKLYFPQESESWRRAPIGWFHNLDCQLVFAREQVQKKYEKEAKEKRKEFKARKVQAKGIKHWIKETQKVINADVRARDAGMPCISCGKHEQELSTKALHGSVWDAGHYKAVGAFPELRFDRRNINGQCRSCNGFKGGMVREQEIGIVGRFGQQRLDLLLSYHKPKHYTIDYLARMRKVIRKRTRTRGKYSQIKKIGAQK